MEHISLPHVCHNGLKDSCTPSLRFCMAVLGPHHLLLFLDQESCGLLDV